MAKKRRKTPVKSAKPGKPKRAKRKTPATKTTRKKAAKIKRPSARAGKKAPAKRTLGKCFVLMPFEEPFDSYYERIIKPGVISAGLEPERGDSLFRPTPIMGDIWKMIQDAKVLVAEMTGKNANVFYELGLAHAIGKPVVLVAETMDDVPFDLQALRVIIYDKDDPAWGNKLRNKIRASLEETLSDPAKSVPPMFRKIVKSQAPKESEISARVSALERSVGSLASYGAVPTLQRAGYEFERDLHRANGRKAQAYAAARRAVGRGIPLGSIRASLSERFPPDFVASVMLFLTRGD